MGSNFVPEFSEPWLPEAFAKNLSTCVPLISVQLQLTLNWNLRDVTVGGTTLLLWETLLLLQSEVEFIWRYVWAFRAIGSILDQLTSNPQQIQLLTN